MRVLILFALVLLACDPEGSPPPGAAPDCRGPVTVSLWVTTHDELGQPVRCDPDSAAQVYWRQEDPAPASGMARRASCRIGGPYADQVWTYTIPSPFPHWVSWDGQPELVHFTSLGECDDGQAWRSLNVQLDP